MTTWGAFLASGPADPNVYLVFGKTGWIGGKLIQLLTAQRKKFFLAESRTYDREAVLKEIAKYNPTHILNAAGVTGRPNVDWCEDHKIETVRTNVIGCLTIADVCEVKKIHHLLYATGCIFEYDAAHPIGGPGFTEEDSANFHASFYSHTKAMVEDLLKVYTQTCTLRVRMPISDDLSHRNFVTKIVKYDKVVNVPNSMTCLTELLPISLVMAEKKLTGIYNFCNPGAISHNEVLGLYKKYVDPSYTWTNFTLDEQAKILKAGRSNNTLDHTKLCAALPGVHIDDIHTAMEKVMIRMQANLEAEGVWPDKLPKRTTAAAIDTKDV
jgi:dTDP-4-dehydrorhamnose reductase